MRHNHVGQREPGDEAYRGGEELLDLRKIKERRKREKPDNRER